MNKQKIMEKVREYIDSIPFEVGDFGLAQHPLFTSFGTIDMDEKDESKKLVKIDDGNIERLKEQRYKHIEKNLQKDDGLFGLFMIIHKPYRIPILMKIREELTDKEFTESLIDLWVDTEFPHENGTELMILMFMSADKKYLMTKEEKQKLDGMNEMIVVYRGLQKDAQEKALSWTTEKKTAIWFATRFERKGRVLKAKIPKKHIFAYKEDRNESEIILNPNYLRNTKEVNYEVENGNKN